MSRWRGRLALALGALAVAGGGTDLVLRLIDGAGS